MSRYLLVDGHSVIFHWQDLCALHSRNSQKAREVLRQKLSALHDTGEWCVTLVFDGRGETSSSEGNEKSMAVIYSSAGQTADSIIEKIVGAQETRDNITVVTADEAERETLEALGARVFSPDWLLQELQSRLGDMKNIIDSVHKQARW
ncbi:MAG: NYN domain-containing protein [Verrucomicrobiota bacterium]